MAPGALLILDRSEHLPPPEAVQEESVSLSQALGHVFAHVLHVDPLQVVLFHCVRQLLRRLSRAGGASPAERLLGLLGRDQQIRDLVIVELHKGDKELALQRCKVGRAFQFKKVIENPRDKTFAMAVDGSRNLQESVEAFEPSVALLALIEPRMRLPAIAEEGSRPRRG